jgi:hypothetical protein
MIVGSCPCTPDAKADAEHACTCSAELLAGWQAAMAHRDETNDCMFCNDKPWVVRVNGVKIAEVPKGESRTITTRPAIRIR